MGSRRQGRELALQVLYALESEPTSAPGSLNLIWDNFCTGADPEYCGGPAGRMFAEELVNGVLANSATIDEAIEAKTRNWSISRMARVDLNILRLAVYELLYRTDIPKNVTINEAIEVAKRFGSEDSPSFVNGILDEVASGVPDSPVTSTVDT